MVYTTNVQKEGKAWRAKYVEGSRDSLVEMTDPNGITRVT